MGPHVGVLEHYRRAAHELRAMGKTITYSSLAVQSGRSISSVSSYFERHPFYRREFGLRSRKFVRAVARNQLRLKLRSLAHELEQSGEKISMCEVARRLAVHRGRMLEQFKRHPALRKIIQPFLVIDRRPPTRKAP